MEIIRAVTRLFLRVAGLARDIAWKFSSWLLDQIVSRDWPLVRKRAAVLAGWALVAALVCAAIWALIAIPRWQVNESVGVILHRDWVKAFELENEARKTLTQIIGGGFAIFLLYLTWWRVRVIAQGHITDRYTKAIEQLGKTEDGEPNIEVRLGGIYALERLAFDSPRDHWTIMEVLSAYVRRNAPWPPKDKTAVAASEPQKTEVAPRTDIQAILTVLGRRRRGKKLEPGYLDLSGCDLCGADLRRGHLASTFLIQSHLEGANLTGAHLRGADLRQAHLGGALLWFANLEHAALESAHLEGACLQEANLEHAHIEQANLKDAVLYAANLEGATATRANLEGANLTKANLEGANLTRVNLEAARLWEANLEGANLLGANLGGASLVEANLNGTILDGAKLEVADLRAAKLEGALGLTIEQVKAAKKWELAHYDADFAAELGLGGTKANAEQAKTENPAATEPPPSRDRKGAVLASRD